VRAQTILKMDSAHHKVKLLGLKTFQVLQQTQLGPGTSNPQHKCFDCQRLNNLKKEPSRTQSTSMCQCLN